jgi:hypothetical protein
MRDVLDDDLAELYAVRGADDVRLARLREQLFAEKPAPRSRRWVGVAAVVTAVVMITGLVVLLRPVSRDAPATLPVAPATSLLEAATMLETAERPTAKYRHVKYTIWQTMTFPVPNTDDETGGSFEFEVDVWVPVAQGELVNVFRRYTGNMRPAPGLRQPGPDLVVQDSWAPKLWSTFCASTPCRETSVSEPLPADPRGKLESAAARLLSPYTTNEEKAATYRELAASPEIRWDDGNLTVEGASATFRIDPATGEVVGFTQDRIEPSYRVSGTDAKTGTISWEWTDQRPS